MIPALKHYKPILRVLGIYLFLSFAGCFMVLVRMFFIGRPGQLFLIWNLFLTWVPMVCSLAMNYFYLSFPRGFWRTLWFGAFSAAWVAFYPNAPYIITDFIHLNSPRFFLSHGGYQVPFIVWYDFVMVALFILTGFLLGFVSLYLVQSLIQKKAGPFIGWIFVSTVLFLSSFGIYLGRFIRWNSWDIVVNPLALFQSITESFHRYAAAFTLTFGLFLILIYFALYHLTHLDDQKLIIKNSGPR